MRPIPVDTLAGFRVPELDEPVVGRRQEVIAGVVEITVLEIKFRIISSENCAMASHPEKRWFKKCEFES